MLQVNVNVYRWVDGKVLSEVRDYQSFLSAYGHSVVSMLEHGRAGMLEQGFPVYGLVELLKRLHPIVEAGELVWFVGPTWISLVGQCRDWHSPTKTLAEEVVGPRFNEMDLEDYVNAMASLATQIRATDFQIGTLANPRKQAMLRRLTSLGMTHTTSIVSRRVNNG